jgi:PBSX family phage terminase large subunit
MSTAIAQAVEATRPQRGLRIVYREDLPRYEASIPGVTQFNPRFIPWQCDAINLVRTWDYEKKGKLELLLSGALGSAKSIVLAHLAVTHCLQFAQARVCLGRRTMPDLKETIYATVLEHLRNDPQLEEGVDWRAVPTKGYVRFANGSEIVSRAWGDRKGGKKARSLNISMLIVEELTENDDKDKAAIEELVQRVGRLRHVPEKVFVAATNPDEPDHWVFSYFIATTSPNRKVIYSITTDNPFLDSLYHQTLLRDLDPRMALRMIHGRWISIAKEGVYHQYDRDLHEPPAAYSVDPSLPIVVSFDFNIGVGKPLSCTFSQFKGGVKHFFAEVVIEGARTQNALEDAWNRGLFDLPTQYYIRGDASGTHKDTRNNLNDYMVIDEWLKNQVRKDGSRIMWLRQVPVQNPPVRARHNVVNAWLRNDLGQVRIQVYPGCKVLREGMKLVKLKKGAEYVEDDSKFFQHVTTAAAYDIYYEHAAGTRGTTTVRKL